MKVLFSVYNISGYLLAELKALVATGADVTVIETPWNIQKGEMAEKVHWVDRAQLAQKREELLNAGFDVFFCGGWFDKGLMALNKALHRRGVKTVLLCDTPWEGKAKQWIHCLISRFYLVPQFDYAWGAGAPQAKYMRLLGFRPRQIKTGYYCADTEKFAPIGKEKTTGHGDEVSRKWPHSFLYIGRYVAVKNMRRMERAFLKAIEQMPESDWTLKCIGGGTLWEERTQHPRIEHLGYKPPADVQNFVKDAGCFVLPSLYEPWGVVVHEAALMGLPMLCSSQIQAATKYLETGRNGFRFNPLDEDEMAAAFVKVMMMSDQGLAQMGQASFALGMSYTTKDWASRIEEFVK